MRLKEFCDRFSDEKRLALRMAEELQRASSLSSAASMPDPRYSQLANRAEQLYRYLHALEKATEELSEELENSSHEVSAILDEAYWEGKSHLNRVDIDPLL